LSPTREPATSEHPHRLVTLCAMIGANTH